MCSAPGHKVREGERDGAEVFLYLKKKGLATNACCFNKIE